MISEPPRGKPRRALPAGVEATILDAAAAVLAERAAASMADVAEAAGVGRSTLYRYFPSREVLIAALAEAALLEAGERIRQARLATVPVEEAVARLARGLVAVGNRYIVLAREGSSLDPQLLERECRTPMLALFARGQATGLLRTDLPLEWLDTLFADIVISGVHTAGQQGIGTEETAATVVSLFLDGVREPPRS